MLDDACMTLTCKVLTQQQSINSVLQTFHGRPPGSPCPESALISLTRHRL